MVGIGSLLAMGLAFAVVVERDGVIRTGPSTALPPHLVEWGGFRGPNGTGVATSAVALPKRLDPDTNVRWTRKFPKGYSSPVVAGDRLFLTAEGPKALYTVCLDRWSGDKLWHQEVALDGEIASQRNSSASPSAATDGEVICVLFHNAGLITYDVEGEELWRLPAYPFAVQHGMSTSPILHGERVIMVADQQRGGYIVALDRRTGREIWRADRSDHTYSYSTPAVYAPPEGPAELIVSGSNRVEGYSIDDGTRRWWVEGAGWLTKGVPAIADGVAYVNTFVPMTDRLEDGERLQPWSRVLDRRDRDGDGRIAASEWKDVSTKTSWETMDDDGDGVLDEEEYTLLLERTRQNGALFAIRLGGEGDVTKSHVLWKVEPPGLPDVTSPLVVGDSVITVGHGGIVIAYDRRTGERRARRRVGAPDDYYASPILGDDKVYLLGYSGLVTTLRVGKKISVLASGDLGQTAFATPAIAGDCVFIRTERAMWCFGAGGAQRDPR